MPFRWTAAALMFAVVTSLPLLASAKEEEKDPVVAKVNGEEIRRSALDRARTLLPEQYRQIPMEMVFKVTDEAIRKRYDTFVEAAASNEEIHARHILLKTEDEAKAVIGELDEGGDFAQLARDKSTGPSGPGGGDLGFFGRGQMVPEFEEAAFKLEAGKHTDTPVKTQFGWHVIKVEERRKAEPPPFEQAEEQLRAELQQTVGAAYVERLRKDAEIEHFNLDGNPQEEASDKKPE